MWATLLGVLLGGFLTVIGSLVLALITERRSRARDQTRAQVEAAKEVLASLQRVNRNLIDMARIERSDITQTQWDDIHAAATRWNVALYGAALICPASEVEKCGEIDKELDRLIDLVTTQLWPDRAFRPQRQRLGRLGAEYLVLVRKNAGQDAVPLSSLWSWGSSVDEVPDSEPS